MEGAMQIEENGQGTLRNNLSGKLAYYSFFSNALAIIEAAKPHRGNLSHAFRMLTNAWRA